MHVKIFEEHDLVEKCVPQSWFFNVCGPITLKQLNKLTTIDTLSFLVGLDVTH